MRVTRVLVGLAVAVVLLAASLPAGAHHPRRGSRTLQDHELAVYEWTAASRMTIEEAEARLDFVAEEGFDTVYLDLSDYLEAADQPESPERQQQLEELAARIARYVADAGRRGLTVHGVGGGPRWTEDGHRYLGPLLVDLVADYNQDVEADERLAGVHLDVEPWALPGFLDDWEASATAYLETVEEIVDAYEEELEDDDNRHLQLGFAVPFWFDAGRDAPGRVRFDGRTKPAVYHLIDLLEDLPRTYLVVMSYRNFARGRNGSIFHAKKEFIYARKVDCDCGLVVGQQFSPDPETPTTSFHNQGRAAFVRAASQIVAAFGHLPQFRGLSVDDLDAYRDEMEEGSST